MSYIVVYFSTGADLNALYGHIAMHGMGVNF